MRDLAVVMSLLALLLAPAAVCAEGDRGRFLLISDIHFDPFYDASLLGQLESEPVENWSGVLEKAQPPGFNRLGTDTNYALLKSSLDDVRRRIPKPDFVLFPGDSMCHWWQRKYDKMAKQTHLENPQAYREFTAKAIRFVAGQLRERFPKTPILPALGNSDSFCGDYMITPDGAFAKMFAAAWAPLLGPDIDRTGFRESFSKGGYYTLKLPHMKNHRLIVLNSVFFSIKYSNSCGPSTQTPALDQLRWFDQTLKQAEAVGEKVWLLMHVPPGVNSYDSARSVEKGGSAVSFWQRELTSRYLQLIRRYQSTIQTAFAGHTHADDFRVIRFDGRPVLLTKIAPSISPVFGNNPGYQIYGYNRRTSALENYRTYWLDLSAGGKPAPAAAGRWAVEYDFQKTYRQPGVNADVIAAWAHKIKKDAAITADYRRFYGVSAPSELSLKTLGVYRCAILCVTPAEFQACYSDVAKLGHDPRRLGQTMTTKTRTP